ncbi:hypothetical protein, partial [Burkholderia ubonensis]|uniref:hypothetical protein n=1 Tax=Burkholderia ubonensis TaxID=101571 RepID=UPI001C4336A5
MCASNVSSCRVCRKGEDVVFANSLMEFNANRRRTRSIFVRCEIRAAPAIRLMICAGRAGAAIAAPGTSGRALRSGEARGGPA